MVDAARRQGGAATIDLHVLPTVGTVDEMANVSSLILRGEVVSLATRLSKDERIVVTEYEIAPQTFYKGSFAVQSRPGLATGLIVQRPGGTMSLNGLQLNTTLDDFPEYEAMKVGEDNPDGYSSRSASTGATLDARSAEAHSWSGTSSSRSTERESP